MNAPFERKDVVRVTPVFCIWPILTICLRSELQTQLSVISTAEGGPQDDEPESSRGHLPKVCGPNERHKSAEALISANVSTRAPETSGCLIEMLISSVLKYRNKCFCLLLQVHLGFLML